ncbi:hypothetical protein BGZ93_002900 [Podila epicladia]|nr:hypothetical protein BGZ93_002900 [Podila epicladia]
MDRSQQPQEAAMSVMSSQTRTSMASSHSRLNQFSTNKRIASPGPSLAPNSKVVVVISDTDPESEGDNNSIENINNLFTGSSHTNPTTTPTSVNRFSQSNRASWLQDAAVIELSSEESDNDSSEYVNLLGTRRLYYGTRRASTPRSQQHLQQQQQQQQQPPLSNLSSKPSSSSPRLSGSPSVHNRKSPQPRPRPIRRGRVNSNTNSQMTSALPEIDLMQEGRRRSITPLLEREGALGTIGSIDRLDLEEPTQYHDSNDQQQELAGQASAQIGNASNRSTVDPIEDIKVEKEESPFREMVVAPPTEVRQEAPSGEKVVAPSTEVCHEESQSGVKVVPPPKAVRQQEIPSRANVAAPPTEVCHEKFKSAVTDRDPTATCTRQETSKRSCYVTEEQREEIRRIEKYVSNILAYQNRGESEASGDHSMDIGLGDDEPIQQQVQLDVTGDETEIDADHIMDGVESMQDVTDHVMAGIESVKDAKNHLMTQCDGFDEDFDYDADYILGGEFEIPSGIAPQVCMDIDYQAKMDESYQASIGQVLLYQKQVKERLRRSRETHLRPARNTVQNITQDELEYITWRVQECTRRLEPVDWEIIAGEANREYRSYRPIPVESWQRAFEDMISMYGKKPNRVSDSTQFGRLTRLRELGGRSGGRSGGLSGARDRMHLALLKSYQFATTFNFSSASVVDIAIKCDGPSVKLAIANVATQDAYNRPGNLVFCDLQGGFCKHMAGHESFDETESAYKTVTVNDVKLSYSKKFLYSGGDDGKAMVWDAETGKLLDQIGEWARASPAHAADYLRSDQDIPVHVNRVAVVEDSIAHEDIFATCSSEGGINIYKVNEDGRVCMKNRPLAIPGAKRIVSSLAFGHGHFWDILVAGVEGPIIGSSCNADHQQGQIVFFDANYITKPTDLGFRQAGHKALPRSVSCLAFSASGEFVVCGTSGRTSGDEDENGDGIIRIFDVRNTKEIQSAVTRHEDVNLVDFSPCGNYVISCSHTNEITVFDRRFLPPKAEYRPLHVWRHPDPENGEQHVGITSAIWWPTFRQQGLCTSSQAMLMTGGGDGCVRLWDLRAATEDAHLWSMNGRVGPVARVAAAPELEHIFVGGDTGAVNVFTIDQGIVSQYEREPMHFVDEYEEEI